MEREEAINNLKKVLGFSPTYDEAFYTLFPEFKESEDESIRKAIIGLLEEIEEDDNYCGLWHIKPMIAYLEKQKEQKEIPLMNDDADLYFDEWNQQNQNPTKRQCFEEGMKYAQRLQKEQKPVDKFQEYLNASPAERRKMNMDEILGDNKGHQKTPDALTTDSNKKADTSDCKYKNLDDIAQEYIDGVKQYNPEPTWDLMQTAVCYGYHLAENKQKPVEWSEEDENRLNAVMELLENTSAIHPNYSHRKLIIWLKSLRPSWKPGEVCYGAKGDPDPAGVWKPCEELPSEDLEKAALKYFDDEYVDACQEVRDYMVDFFRAGAEWQKEQMLKDAVEGRIHLVGFNNAIYIKVPQWTDKMDKFEDGDKVKIIIVKEDKK